MIMFSKKKKIMMVLAVVVVGTLFGTLFGGTLVALATYDPNPLDDIGRKVAEWISIQEEAKNSENEKITNESNASFYELAYAKATSEQKEELDKIIDDKSIGLPGEWRRAVLIAIGDLPKDASRLSAEQAAEIYDSKEISDFKSEFSKISELESEFNKIAGAPDFVGGSGIERSIYFLKDDRSEAIFLMLGHVSYVVFNDDGTQTILPIGTQQLPLDPGPSDPAPQQSLGGPTE